MTVTTGLSSLLSNSRGGCVSWEDVARTRKQPITMVSNAVLQAQRAEKARMIANNLRREWAFQVDGDGRVLVQVQHGAQFVRLVPAVVAAQAADLDLIGRHEVLMPEVAEAAALTLAGWALTEAATGSTS
ncbi:hypothetical protein G7043_31355 [Lentzea sp. NEAU-D13]|uniref:Uncharacterized protein n=1 Tax=Lentzea alba TaxID=2714351 RepID=A0A7C9RUS8_9PSEU|nr:hypothetical protein [Lentzea alba]NGY63430.1 hypothetical protein [Lentzea alba]